MAKLRLLVTGIPAVSWLGAKAGPCPMRRLVIFGVTMFGKPRVTLPSPVSSWAHDS